MDAIPASSASFAAVSLELAISVMVFCNQRELQHLIGWYIVQTFKSSTTKSAGRLLISNVWWGILNKDAKPI